MAYSGLAGFIEELAKRDELQIIREYVNPELEITDITDRVTKSGGKALLFNNTGTGFPVLINAYGSDKRMAMAIGRADLDEVGKEIDRLFENMPGTGASLFKKLSGLPSLLTLARIMPSRGRQRGTCQQIIYKNPDIAILPVLKCWPHDGGRFITLPVVHTIHPDTGKANAGMYRMQILDGQTTAMHWQRHKTGANHFEAWKRKGKRMPVSVSLGGDPVYAYAATAPLPEGIDEFMLAGFLRKKKVRMVRCITNSLYVPSDADIILEGYVDPAEDKIWEGPFGDHTGFYSLADWYPRFHITCITHSKNAVYPATIVGIPPQEDAWLAKATEKIFLSPLKMTLQPEIEDFHMPDAGVAHNLVIVKIRKSYPGQGMKIISSLSGAGQMMFSKYMVVVSGNVDIRDYGELLNVIFENTDFRRDLLFSHGPLDVLDHSSDAFSFGGKLGVDATVKHPEENAGREARRASEAHFEGEVDFSFLQNELIVSFSTALFSRKIPAVIVAVNRFLDCDVTVKVRELFRKNDPEGHFRLILIVDHTVNTSDLHMVAWQVLGNSDPERDHEFITSSSLAIDGTIKAFRKGGFPRKWPNVVCSARETIDVINGKWGTLGLGPSVRSPSETYSGLVFKGNDEIISNSPGR